MLGAFQKKVAALAITSLSICVICAFVVALFALLGAFLEKFGTVVWPLAVALIASFILKPIGDFLSAKLRISLTVSCIIIFSTVVIFSAAAAILLLPRLVSDLVQIASLAPDAIHNAIQRLGENFPVLKDSIAEKLAQLRADFAHSVSADSLWNGLRGTLKTLRTATGGAVSFCSFCAAFAVIPIYLFYMLTSKFDFFAFMEKKLDFLHDETKSDLLFFARRFSDIMSTFFRGQLLIAIIMGILLGTGFGLCGIRFGFLLGFCAGVINIVPYLGTVIGLGTILPVAFFQDGGGMWLAAAALGVFCAVQFLEAYLLTPRIMGNRTGLHPTVIIFSVFFWGIALNGILGMILAIPLTALIVASWGRLATKIRRFTR